MPYIALRISSDGGATWGPSKPLCACKGGGQFDPIIEVVPRTGSVYALYMNGFNVVFVKSTDHGATWSAPVKTYGNVSWNDKPVIAVSDDGRDVYATFNGPTGGDPWLAQSHDFGATWTQTKLVNSDRYFFAFDADVAPDGTVYLSQSSILYGGGGNKGTTPTGTIDEHVFVSTDRGATWTDRNVAQVQPGLACTAAGCSPDFYLGHSALSADAGGALTLLYDGASTAGGQQTVVARRSTDRGATWTAPVTLSKAGEMATSPAVESGAAGDVRAWWMETNGGNVDAWNVWYRRSTDGGVTWASPVKLSDATAGAALQDAGRLPRALRRLRGDGDQQRRQDHRDLGRRRQLGRSRRRLVQPGAVAGSPSAARTWSQVGSPAWAPGTSVDRAAATLAAPSASGTLAFVARSSAKHATNASPAPVVSTGVTG